MQLRTNRQWLANSRVEIAGALSDKRAWQLTHIEWQVEGRRSASRSLMMGSLQTVRQMMGEVGTMLAWTRVRINHNMRALLRRRRPCMYLDCTARLYCKFRFHASASFFSIAHAKTSYGLSLCLVLAESISKALIFISISSGRDALLLAAFQ